ncbi:argonaute-like protein [Marasmius fiardii PR-910]|nr:argonaute-like protein [Marasmius fiardii PR-910]
MSPSPAIQRGGSSRGSGAGGRGGRGGGRGRGGVTHAVGQSVATRGGAQGSTPLISDHITTIGVKRPNFGTAGRVVPIQVNSFTTTIPQDIIRHYDVVMTPSEQTMPARLNMEVITALQTRAAPNIFTPPAVYDGRKNMFAARELPLTIGPDGIPSQEFSVTLADPTPGQKAPKVFKVRLTKVAQINPEVLERFIQGNQSHDNVVLTAITALNVVIRMEPTRNHPFNVRSFFTDRERRAIGLGLEVWRGYFQSVRPAINRMLINVDISTGLMYRSGPLIELCLDFFKKAGGDPNILSPARGLPDRQRLTLSRFISGMRIAINSGNNTQTRVVKQLSQKGATELTFNLREGGTMTVAQYFQQRHNRPLRYPDIICVEVGAGAYIPLEMCSVPPGQIVRKQVPPEKTKDVLDFATKRPADRLQSILNGVDVLQYGQSDYVRQFGMHVDTNMGALQVQARVLPPPMLKYGPQSKQRTIQPRNGSWNMVDKKLYQAVTIKNWYVVIFEIQNRFGEKAVHEMVNGFIEGCLSVGIQVMNRKPRYEWANGQGNIAQQLKQIGARAYHDAKQTAPNLVLVVIPEIGNDIYAAVKHFGDCVQGVATQCVKAMKANRAKPQYWANVMLKVNVKLGGINLIPEQSSVSVLTDPRHPTLVMGADVIHPAPGSEGRPSFTALVSNVDSDTAKYIANCKVQTSRQEMIDDLETMSKENIKKWESYQKHVEKKANPKISRIIFYRDGVSEGQFAQVLEQELPRIRKGCEAAGMNPKITVIVVGKRHHVRFFPQSPDSKDQDKSGNCLAGTVVDREIAHPTEFDFYLQSHGGLLGTSRSAHYSVLYDENKFTADELQSLSFALCHVYARSTRSVSIPAPVYYADIVCSRARNHYDPTGSLSLSDSFTAGTGVEATLENYRQEFKPLHANMATCMYFS